MHYKAIYYKSDYIVDGVPNYKFYFIKPASCICGSPEDGVCLYCWMIIKKITKKEKKGKSFFDENAIIGVRKQNYADKKGKTKYI